MNDTVDIYPVIVLRDNTIYNSKYTSMISNKDIGDNNCDCRKARFGSLMVEPDGTRSIWCNECKGQIIPSEANR